MHAMSAREPVHRTHFVARAAPAVVYAVVTDFAAYPRLFPEMRTCDMVVGRRPREKGLRRVAKGFLQAIASGGPVLEVGGGTGRVALALAQRGIDVTAVEISAELVRRLRAADCKAV